MTITIEEMNAASNAAMDAMNKALYGDDNPRPSKAETLDKAKETVADRGVSYGTVQENFGRIAALWTTHVKNRYADGYGGDTTMAAPTLDAHDVATMMILMKVARLENDPTHEDSWVDVAGYAACGNNLPKVD